MQYKVFEMIKWNVLGHVLLFGRAGLARLAKLKNRPLGTVNKNKDLEK